MRWLLPMAFMFLSQHLVAERPACPDFLDVTVRKLHAKETVNLCDLYQSNQAMLVVNTASHCGYTPQFKGLEALHQAYKDKGLVILGFPSADFKQEEDSEKGTAKMCYENYGVSFPMFQHIRVKGDKAHSLFAYLAKQTQAPSWNFNKFLITDGGNKVTHFSSKTEPRATELEAAIRDALDL